MQSTKNRAQRRRLRAVAKTAAPSILAGAFQDKDPGDPTAKAVTHPAAQAFLERAVRLVLTEAGEPQVLELPPGVAAHLCTRATATPLPEARHFMAVGFDRDGRAAYTTRLIAVGPGLDRVAARRLIEGMMLADLAPHLARSGWECRA